MSDEQQHQTSPISSLLISGTQWISTNAETQIPVVEGGPVMSPPMMLLPSSSPIQSTLHHPQTPSTLNMRSTLRHRFPHTLPDLIVMTPPNSPAMNQLAREEQSLANFSQSADEKILSSLKRLKEKGRSSTDSQKVLKKENDTLKKQLEDFKQKLIQSALPQTLLDVQNMKQLNQSKQLNHHQSPADQEPLMDIAHLQSLIGRNIPKPDGMSTRAHQGRLMDRLVTMGEGLMNQSPQVTLTKISASVGKGLSKGKSWVQANQATIIRVAIIILVISLAPSLLPFIGI